MKNILLICSLSFFIPILGMELSDPALSFLNAIPEGSTVGIYCGTFDPIHKGHSANITYCLEQGKADFVIVHVGSAPEKPHATDRALRALMTHATLASNPRIFVSTKKNLSALHELLGQKNCMRISIWGSDNLPRLVKPSDPQKKDPFPCEEFIILPREEDKAVIEPLRAQPTLKEKRLHIAALEALPHRDLSSTKIRNIVGDSGAYNNLQDFVHPAALVLMQNRRLYHSTKGVS